MTQSGAITSLRIAGSCSRNAWLNRRMISEVSVAFIISPIQTGLSTICNIQTCLLVKENFHHSDPEGSPARRRLLDTATRLFYTEGIRAVGIDRIIAEAGVAKATFYKHFPSKDELVVAYIEEQDRLG